MFTTLDLTTINTEIFELERCLMELQRTHAIALQKRELIVKEIVHQMVAESREPT